MTKKLGVGVLGVGEMGRRHAENLRHLVPNAQLVAVADAVEERARKVAGELEIEKSFGSLEAMLEHKGIDAIIIATPDAFHAPAVSQGAAAGKAMLCALTRLRDFHRRKQTLLKLEQKQSGRQLERRGTR